jgi:SAM-dependent methyltransferase
VNGSESSVGENPSGIVRILRNILGVVGLDSAGRKVFHRLQPSRRNRPLPSPSETSKCRPRLAAYCTGYGLDLGFGGDPIVPHAIGMDMPQPYSDVGKLPVQLGGDASRLVWFADGTLDFVFSSHLLEDFRDVGAVLREWLRVLRVGGRLIIFCPDEQVYRRHCAANGLPPNQHHVYADFSLAFVKRELLRLGVPHLVLHENPLVDVYSWEIVVEKLAGDSDG